jgi:transcriptional antiterminator RfaH
MNNWYCVYTKPKQEAIINRRLVEHPGIELFSPKAIIPGRIRSRHANSVEELFPCYLFLKFEDPKYFHMIRYTRGVKRFVGDSSGIPYAVDERIINMIRTGMKDGFVHLGPTSLTPGDKVVVIGGALEGLRGIFLSETKPRERVMILLNFIQNEAKVEVPREYIVRA